MPAIKRDYIFDSIGEDIEKIINLITLRWSGYAFSKIAERIAANFVNSVSDFEDRTFSIAAAQAVGIDAYSTPELRRALELSTKTNAQLIKSLSSEHIDQIANLVYANIQQGHTPSQIEENIINYGASVNRAKLIARDQTSKVLGDISRIKQQSAGFEYFQWDTSHDERVRSTHREAGRKRTKFGIGVYRWDDLPLVGGRKLAPGMDYQCRCVALPIADWEVEEFQEKEGKK